MISIEYRKSLISYKYELLKTYEVQLGHEFPDVSGEVETKYLYLNEKKFLAVKAGYNWDGPSGPAIDTKNFMRGSLVHDALYQLMRRKDIEKATFRIHVDRLLYTMCREDGMWWPRATWVYYGVRIFGNTNAMKHTKTD